MIHLYCGNGKGKTTAAMGLAVRAAGRGKSVLIAQFLKSSNSGERFVLSQVPWVTLLPLPDRVKFTFQMDEQDRTEARGRFLSQLNTCEEVLSRNGAEMVVLDEVCAAVNAGLLPLERVTELLDRYGEQAELVLTGRDPAEALLSRAQYVTEMKAIRHPYEQGVLAREGVEY